MGSGQGITVVCVFHDLAQMRDGGKGFECEVFRDLRQRLGEASGGMQGKLVDDDPVDRDVDLISCAFDEFCGLGDRQFFGQGDREQQGPLAIVDEFLDPARMTRERTGPDRLLNDPRNIQEGQTMTGGRRIDDQDVVERLTVVVALLFQVPDLSEDDQLPPARCGLEQLLKRFPFGGCGR